MRRVLLSTISLVALTAGSSFAADIPRPAPVYKAACGAVANNIDFTTHIVRAGVNYKF